MSNQFIGQIGLDTTQAVSALEEVSSKAGEASRSIEELGTESSEAMRDLAESAESASDSMGSLHEVSGRLERMNLQQTFGAVRGAVNDLREAIGSQTDRNASGGSLVSSMLALGASGAEIGAMFGPQGAIIGGIVGFAIPALIRLGTELGVVEESHDSAADAARRQTDETRELGEEALTAADRISQLQRAVSEQRSRARLAQIESGDVGELSAEDAALAAEAARQRAREASTQRGAFFMFASGELDVSADLNRASEADARAAQGNERRRGGSRRRRDEAPNLSGMGASPELFDEIDSAEEILGQFEESAGERFDAMVSNLSNGFDEIRERGLASANAFDELQNSAKEASETFRDSWNESVDDVIQAFERANEAAKAAGRTQIAQGRLMEQAARSVGNQALQSIGEDVSRAFAASIAAAITGAESFEKVLGKMVQGILNSLLQEAIVQAVREVALGISDVASYKYDSAAAHFAAAGAWGAVAAAAGVGLGAVSAASGGGGGSSPSASATASPSNNDEKDSKPSVYNIYYSNPMFQNREEQLDMFRKLEAESARRY